MTRVPRTVLLAIPVIALAVTAATLVSADTIADSVADFSGEQGLHGWTYGYWDQSKDADGEYDQASDFQLFSSFGNDRINGLSSHSEFTTGDLWFLEDGRYYTSLWAEGGHPHGTMDLGSYAKADQWVVRRWTSTVSGRIEISGHAGKVMPWGENWRGSTRFLIVAAGDRVFEAEVDDGGKEYSVSVEVEAGTPVDFLIGPGSAIGVMRFTARLSEPEESAIGPPTRLRFETVRSILEDSQGNYWFGSWNEGVARFDGNSITYFTVDDGLSDNQIRSIHEDRNGVVWFEGGIGLSGFDGERIVTPTHRNYTTKDDWRLDPGDLWFKEDESAGPTGAEAQPGVYRYDGETFTYLAYPLPEDHAQDHLYATTGIARGKSGRIWFATYDAVLGYDGKSFITITDESIGLDETTGSLHVRSILEDSKGRLWIGNNGIGVILYDGNTFTQFTQEHGLGESGAHGGRTVPQPGDVTDGSPTLHRVFSIGEDRAGNIWFGTIDHGAWRYDGESLRNFAAADGLTSKDVMGIYTDRRGDLWVAGNGVFRFDGTSFDRMF